MSLSFMMSLLNFSFEPTLPVFWIGLSVTPLKVQFFRLMLLIATVSSSPLSRIPYFDFLQVTFSM